VKSLQRIVDDLPDTEAALQAKSLLDEMSGTATP
jgi:hypothetical protein